MKWTIPIHPLLVAAYPVLALFSSNTSLIPVHDIWRPLLLLCGLALLLWLVIGLTLKSVEKGATASSLLMIGLLGFGHATPWVTTGSRNTYLVVWWVVILLITFWVVKRYTKPANRFLNVASVLLVALATYNTVKISLTYRQVASKGSHTISSHLKSKDLPDIFYIILDGYGSEAALKHAFGYSNASFIEELNKRGFYVANDSKTNYCETELSLASSLNLQYLPDLIKDVPKDSSNRIPLDQLITNNEATRELELSGYRFLAITTGFPGIRFDKGALIQAEDGSYTLFEASLIRLMAVPQSVTELNGLYDTRRHQINKAFDTLKQISGRTQQPRFVFAHILAPHPPFNFGPNGEPKMPKGMPWGYWDGSHYLSVGGTEESYRTGYTEQVQYINKRVLEAIDSLIEHEEKRSIIIIQGDHGSKLRLDQESLEKTDIAEVFPILNAYYVPESIRKDLYPTISPVNSLRMILRHVLDAKLPNVEDRNYYASWPKPYQFVDVTDQLKKK